LCVAASATNSAWRAESRPSWTAAAVSGNRSNRFAVMIARRASVGSAPTAGVQVGGIRRARGCVRRGLLDPPRSPAEHAVGQPANQAELGNDTHRVLSPVSVAGSNPEARHSSADRVEVSVSNISSHRANQVRHLSRIRQ
jgi:hypothetical protein